MVLTPVVFDFLVYPCKLWKYCRYGCVTMRNHLHSFFGFLDGRPIKTYDERRMVQRLGHVSANAVCWPYRPPIQPRGQSGCAVFRFTPFPFANCVLHHAIEFTCFAKVLRGYVSNRLFPFWQITMTSCLLPKRLHKEPELKKYPRWCLARSRSCLAQSQRSI